MVGKVKYTQLLECIFMADKDAELLDGIVQDLEVAYKNHDMQGVVKAVIGSVSFIQGLKQTIPTCSSVTESLNWKTFDQIVAVIKNPLTHMEVVNKDLVLNGKIITTELSDSFEAWNAGNWSQFGYSLGTTLKDTCAT